LRNTLFHQQATLLLDILPVVFRDKRFAIKGGTDINFFIRNVPRLSVDIDLTWLPMEDHETAIGNSDRALRLLSLEIERIFPTVNILPGRISKTEYLNRLIVRKDNVRIKIEPNLVFRGTVYPVVEKMLTQQAQDLFKKAVRVQTLSSAEVYAGKICAALDRQHPRDLFDIKLLFENEGFTDSIKKAFIVYLISHNRPIVELLNPNRLDLGKTFELEFRGMAFEPVSLTQLIETRERLISVINRSLTIDEKRFIFSVKQGQPDWKRFPLEHIRDLPAVQWKLYNIRRMGKDKHRRALEKLAAFLEHGTV